MPTEIVFLIVAIFSGLCCLIFLTTNSTYSPIKNSTKPSQHESIRFKCNASSQQNNNERMLIGAKISNMLSESFSTRHFFHDFIESKNYSNITSAHISSQNKYVKLSTIEPLLSISFNVPSMECYLNSSYNFTYIKLQPIYEEMKHDSCNEIQITNMTARDLELILVFLADNIEILEALSKKIDQVSMTIDGKKTMCKFNSRCYLEIRYLGSNRFSLNAHFSRLSRETNKLTPRIGNRAFSSKNHTKLYNFNDIRSPFLIATRLLRKTFTEKYNLKLQTYFPQFSSLLESESRYFKYNFAMEIINEIFMYKHIDRLSERLSKKSKGVHELKSYVEIPGIISKKKQVEFTTFLGETLEYFNISSMNSSVEYQCVSAVFTFISENLTRSYGINKQYHPNKNIGPRFPLLSLANENLPNEMAAIDNENESREYALRKVLIEAYFELLELIYYFKE